MSDPLRKHVHDPREGQWVAARFAEMRCDGANGRCKLPPVRTPTLQIPPAPWKLGESPRNITLRSTLHFCQRHTGEMTVDKLLQPQIKASAENLARKAAKWHGFKPDFDAAWIMWELVTTPEYRAFLAALELNTARLDRVI